MWTKRQNGIVATPKHLAPGYVMNPNCIVVGNDSARGVLFAAPVQLMLLPSLSLPEISQTDKNVFAHPSEDLENPGSWDLNLVTLANVKQEEWDFVLSLLFSRVH